MQRPKGVSDADWADMQKELSRFQGTSLTPAAIQNARPEDLGNSVAMEMEVPTANVYSE